MCVIYYLLESFFEVFFFDGWIVVFLELDNKSPYGQGQVENALVRRRKDHGPWTCKLASHSGWLSHRKPLD